MWNALHSRCAASCKVLVVLALFAGGAVHAAPERRLTSTNKQEPEQKSERPAPAREPRKEERVTSYSAKLTLGGGRSVRGQIKLQMPERIDLSHEADGVHYDRQIAPSEIASIEILKWKHKFIRENRQGLVYEFYPEEVRIRLRDGAEMKRSGPLFAFLKQFTLENRNGKTALFTYWVDLKKPDGSWHTGLSGPENGIRVVCHPDVVRRIDFD